MDGRSSGKGTTSGGFDVVSPMVTRYISGTKESALSRGNGRDRHGIDNRDTGILLVEMRKDSAVVQRTSSARRVCIIIRSYDRHCLAVNAEFVILQRYVASTTGTVQYGSYDDRHSLAATNIYLIIRSLSRLHLHHMLPRLHPLIGELIDYIHHTRFFLYEIGSDQYPLLAMEHPFSSCPAWILSYLLLSASGTQPWRNQCVIRKGSTLDLATQVERAWYWNTRQSLHIYVLTAEGHHGRTVVENISAKEGPSRAGFWRQGPSLGNDSV